MEDIAATQNLESGASSLDSVLKLSMVAVFFLGFFFQGGLIYMIQLVRALQMVLHLPMMRILLPPNALMFISVIIEIAMFDILPAEYTTDLIFEYDDSLEKID